MMIFVMLNLLKSPTKKKNMQIKIFGPISDLISWEFFFIPYLYGHNIEFFGIQYNFCLVNMKNMYFNVMQ